MSFNQRKPIGDQAEEWLEKCMTSRGIRVIRLGDTVKNCIDEDPIVSATWKTDAVKRDMTAVMVRYMPDFLLVKLDKARQFERAILVDVKAMFTPVFANTFFRDLESKHGRRFSVEQIGNVEREAWQSYGAYQLGGARVAICAVTTFHSRPILCEYVDRIQDLYKDDRIRNPESAGSTTPRVNIDLATMRSFEDFVRDELGVDLSNHSTYGDEKKELESQLSFIGAPSYFKTKQHLVELVENVRERLSSQLNKKLSIFWIGR